LRNLTVVTEFENLAIANPTPGKPDVALSIHKNSVLHLRPIVSVARTAPRFRSDPSVSNSSTGGAGKQHMA